MVNSQNTEKAGVAVDYARALLIFVRDLFYSLVKGILFYVLLLPPAALAVFLILGYFLNGGTLPALYYTIPVAILIALAAVATGAVLGFDRAIAGLSDALADLIAARTWQVTQALVPRLKESSTAGEIQAAVEAIADNPPPAASAKGEKGLLRRAISKALDKLVWGGVRYSLKKDFVATVSEAMENAGDDSGGYTSAQFVQLAQEQLVQLTIERVTFVFHLRNILVGGAFALLVLILAALPALI